MTQYSFAATVKAMKIQEVILRAASGEILWIDAADIIGVSYRTMKRWKSNYEEFGYDGIFDRRMRTPSPKSAPLSEIQTILQLYRTHYKGFNATHFHEKLKEHHNIHRGYTFVKKLLQTAGEIDKTRTRDKHRIRRPRKPLVGMMLHLDGSSHEWIPDLPGVFYDLLVLLDDATNRIYEMVLVDEEDTLQCMTLLMDCVAKRGIFCSLYSDRAAHFFLTPKAGDKVQEGHLTQIGRALNELGIRMIPAYSPQARGRSERMNATLQGRLPNEFKLHGIKTKEQANRFLKDHYIAQLNKRFAKTPEQPGSAFVPPHIPGHRPTGADCHGPPGSGCGSRRSHGGFAGGRADVSLCRAGAAHPSRRTDCSLPQRLQENLGDGPGQGCLRGAENLFPPVRSPA